MSNAFDDLSRIQRGTPQAYRSVALSYCLTALGSVAMVGLSVWGAYDSYGFSDSRLAYFAWVLAMILAGYLGFGVAPSLRAPTLLQELRRDTRAPVLFLRSFSEDTRSAPDRPHGDKTDGNYRGVHSNVKLRVELLIAPAMKRIGPFVAIGNPSDQLSPLGAARLHVPHDQWQSVVWKLSTAARLVLLQVGETPGTSWELLQAVHRLDPRTLVLLVPDPAARPLGYMRVREFLARVFTAPLPAADEAAGPLVLFDQEWRPTVISADNAEALHALLSSRLRDVPPPPPLDEAWRAEVPALPEHLVAAVSAVRTVTPSQDRTQRERAAVSDAPLSPGVAPLNRDIAAFFGRVAFRRVWVPFYMIGGVLAAFVVPYLFMSAGVENGFGTILLLTIIATLVAARVHRAAYERRQEPKTAVAEIKRALPRAMRGSSLAEEVARDVAGGTRPAQWLVLGREWLVTSFSASTAVARFDDIMWMYPVVSTQRTNGITTSRRRYVAIYLRDGSSIRAGSYKGDRERVWAALTQCAPQALTGLTPQLLDAWNQDFSEFVRLVDARHAAVPVSTVM
jgi:hypothetical protein